MTETRFVSAGPVERIAVWLALASDDDQAAFLNSVASELLHAAGSHAMAEMQWAHTAKKLTPEAKEMCAMLSYESDSAEGRKG